MIYKIEILKDIPFSKVLDKIEHFGNFCFIKRTFYLNTKKEKDSVIKCFHDIGKISDVNSHDKFESEMIHSWYVEKRSKELIEEFEDSKDGQERITNVMKYLDMVEEKIKDKEVETVANEKNAEGTNKRNVPARARKENDTAIGESLD